MLQRLRVVGVLPLVAVVFGLGSGVAGAEPLPVGRAVGDAGTGLAVVRALPGEQQKPVEVGFGLANASVNSEAGFSFDRSVAQATPGGLTVQGQRPQTPGTLAQTAPPDNPQPVTGGLTLPSTPLDPLVKGGLLNGSVHARWSDTMGACVGTISDASTEVASLALLNAIPSLPSVNDLTGRFDASSLDANADNAIVEGLKKLAGPLSTLGGVLSGPGRTGATGSLVSLPETLSAHSTVQLVDLPGSANKAVRSTSTMRVDSVKLLAGTPFEVSVNVVSQPTLQVTSTGDAATSTVSYTAPVLDVVQGGRSLGRLDAANPKLDLPIGIPLPAQPAQTGPGNLPIIGDLLANGQPVTDAVGQGLHKLDLGVIRLSIAQLNQKSQQMTTPFNGFQLGATARLLDLQVLPTAALGLANLPSALAQVTIGEQVARAYAPTGGVVCATPAGMPAPPPAPMPKGKLPGNLAHTSVTQYQTIPLFWAGTAMLMAGVVMVAAFPRRFLPLPALADPESASEPEPADEPEPDQDGESEAAVED